MHREYGRLLNRRLGNHHVKNGRSSRIWIPGGKLKVGGKLICWGGTFLAGIPWEREAVVRKVVGWE